MKRMKSGSRSKASKLRSWAVTLIRSRGQYLGSLQAPDRAAAEPAAIKAFNLQDSDRKRLLVTEQLS